MQYLGPHWHRIQEQPSKKITQTHILHVYAIDTKHERVVLLKAYQVVALNAFFVDGHHTRHKEFRETVLRNYMYNKGRMGQDRHLYGKILKTFYSRTFQYPLPMRAYITM